MPLTDSLNAGLFSSARDQERRWEVRGAYLEPVAWFKIHPTRQPDLPWTVSRHRRVDCAVPPTYKNPFNQLCSVVIRSECSVQSARYFPQFPQQQRTIRYVGNTYTGCIIRTCKFCLLLNSKSNVSQEISKMNLGWFANILVHHPFVVLSAVAVFSGTCIVIPFTLKSMSFPNFQDPQLVSCMHLLNFALERQIFELGMDVL